MYSHHEESIQKLKAYFLEREKPVAIILGGSVVKGNARVDSDIDAMIVVSEARYQELAAQNRLAEVITGHCTYEGGYFDIKYKTKESLRQTAEHGSEPARSAYEKAQVIYSEDNEIATLVKSIAAYPVWEKERKLKCFNANLQLNYGYFLHCTGEDNAYMRAHLAAEIVYSVYRLILLENEVLFPCNRRLEETVKKCKKRPKDILDRGAKLLKEITLEHAEAFVEEFIKESGLAIERDVSINCSNYVEYYEEWWRKERPSFPNEW